MNQTNVLEKKVSKDSDTIRTELNAHANTLPTKIVTLSRGIEMKIVGMGMKVPVSNRNPPYLTREEYAMVQEQLNEMHAILLNHKPENNPEGYQILNKARIYDRALATYFKAVADLAKIKVR